MNSISIQKKRSDLFIHQESSFIYKTEKLVLTFYKPFHCLSQLLAHAIIPLNQSSPILLQVPQKVFHVVCAILLLIPALLILGVGGTIDFMKNRYPAIVLKSKAPLQKSSQLKVLSFNACMMWGALPKFFGGLEPGSCRLKQVEKLLYDKSPDIVFFQEMARPIAIELWEKVKNFYAYGIYNICPKPFVMLDSHLFILTNRTIHNYQLLHLPTGGQIRRVVIALELDTQWLITTHLDAGSEPSDVTQRLKQSKLVTEFIQQLSKDSRKPIVLMGDLNIPRTFEVDCEYNKHEIFQVMNNVDTSRALNTSSCTCTDRFTIQLWNLKKQEKLELVDYCLTLDLDRKFMFEKISNINRAEKSISDHKALILTLNN